MDLTMTARETFSLNPSKVLQQFLFNYIRMIDNYCTLHPFMTETVYVTGTYWIAD